MSSSSCALNTNEQKRDWLDLPSGITENILQRIGAIDILENAQKVCTTWRKICKDPSMWRVIKINNLSSYETLMCKQAVDRSQGQLLDLTIQECDEELLSYIATRSRQLRRLEIIFCSGCNMLRSISEALTKFPYLEELNLYSTALHVKKEFIETVGRYCPKLKTLKLNRTKYDGWIEAYYDEVAIAIGKNLHDLRHLELIGKDMTNIGLQVILDGCLSLETLDLRQCFEIDLDGDLGKRCIEQIKSIKLPNDSLEGSPYSDIYDYILEFNGNDLCISFDPII